MPITLKVADLTAAPQTFNASLETAWCAERAGDVYTAQAPRFPVDITATKVAEVIGVSARVRGKFGFACSRCAEAAELELPAAFDHHFVGPGKLDAGDGEFAVEFDADPDVSEHDGVHVALDDLLIEYLLLELPTAPLCADDCKGLCLTCGTNFNTSSCQCADQPTVLSPWIKLATLQLRDNGHPEA